MPTSVRGTDILFNDSTTQGTAGFTGFRNRIINGDMRIDQRNGGASVTLPASQDRHVVDRWVMQSQGGGTGQRISATIAMGSPYSIKYTASTSSSFFQLGQQIEYQNMSHFQGQTVVISFWAKANNTNSGSTSLVVRTRTSTTIDAGVRFSGANSDTSVTISTTATRYTVTRSIASTVNALSIEFALGSHVSGDGFEITGVQVESGSVATPFEHRQYGTELALCQRYYETGNAKWYNPNSGQTSMFATIYYKVNKRTAPSISFSNTGIIGGYNPMLTIETNYTDSFGGFRNGEELNFGWTSSAEF